MDKQIILLLKSVDESPHCDIGEPPKGCIRIDLGEGSCVCLTPSATCASVTKITAVTRVDPKMQFIPDWLLNAVNRMFAFMIIEGVRQAVDILERDDRYSKRYLDPGNEFYNYLRRRIREEIPAQADTLPWPQPAAGEVERG